MPRPLTFDRKTEKWILSVCQTMTAASIARQVGVSASAMRTWLDRRGLKLETRTAFRIRQQGKIGTTSFTKAEDAYIRKHITRDPVKVIATALGISYCGVMGRVKAMGLSIPPDVKQRHLEKGRFKPGQVSHNKGKKMPAKVYAKAKATMFKKGNIPWNTRHDGAISLRVSKDGIKYLVIRVSLANWETLARYKWKLFNGPIPAHSVIYHINGDTLNCAINNLGMMSKKDNMLRNSIINYPPEIRSAIQILTHFNRKIRQYEKQK